jgi:hypothetical protein
MKKPLIYRSEAVLEKPSQALQELLCEYTILSTKSNPTEEEEDRLEAILSRAEEEDQLAFWIVVTDARISENLGLLEPQHYQDYEEQHKKLIIRLSEHIEASYEAQEEVIASCPASGEPPRIYPADIESIFATNTKRLFRKNP